MQTTLSSRRYHYVALVSSFAILVALIAGTVGCAPQCNLTISSTAGGSVTTPGEGASKYGQGAVVDLVATPDAGYRFVSWTGDVDKVNDIYAAETTITMNGDYSITANFEAIAAERMTIRDWYDLHAIRDNLSGHYVLMSDLDSKSAGYHEMAGPDASNGKGWEPIGSAYRNPDTGEWEAVDPFVGTFDGQGYEIADLFVDRPDEDGVGLFGAVNAGGIIQDVGVINADVTGGWAVGALVGQNWYGTVTACHSTGDVTGDSVVGGLAGRNWYGAVVDSHSAGNVTGVFSVGGLVGANSRDGIVMGSWSVVSVTGTSGVGGLVGNNHQSAISASYGGGSVTGQYCVGGLVGSNDHATLTNSYSATIVAGNHGVGGLVGSNYYGSVDNSHADAFVTGFADVGGLVGANDGTVSNSYATGNVTGDVSVGGLVGSAGETEGTASNSFWNTETSGQTDSAGGIGKITAEMKTIATFSDAGWSIVAVADPGARDPSSIWNIADGETYPFLSWQAVS